MLETKQRGFRISGQNTNRKGHDMTPKSRPENMTTTEAADHLNVKPSTLEQWRWQGKGPRFVKMGRCVRYRRADLDAFAESLVFGSTTEAQAGRRG
jgi:excisionase family DNA binding protein